MSFHRDVDFILGMDGSRFYCHNVHLVSQPPHSTVLIIIIILILIIFTNYHRPYNHHHHHHHYHHLHELPLSECKGGNYSYFSEFATSAIFCRPWAFSKLMAAKRFLYCVKVLLEHTCHVFSLDIVCTSKHRKAWMGPSNGFGSAGPPSALFCLKRAHPGTPLVTILFQSSPRRNRNFPKSIQSKCTLWNCSRPIKSWAKQGTVWHCKASFPI